MTYVATTDQDRPAGGSVAAEASLGHSSAHPPVFLHCGWRTRSTWIWNCFREMTGVTGYYEPLNECLGAPRSDTLAAIDAGSWPSGHNGLSRPYFDEFRGLPGARQAGVPLYQSRFATEDFFADPDSPAPELARYLRSLMRAAQDRGEQPVLKFCRSLGRIGWMRRNFPDAVHVVVMRDPFSQFASSARHYVRHENGYFLAMPLLLLAMNRHLKPVRDCARHLDVELPDLTREEPGLAACEAVLRTGTPASWYRGFLAFWTVAVSTIPDTVDLIIDGDALAYSGAYRARCAAELARLTGRTVDFSDADASSAIDMPRMRPSDVLRAHTAAEAFLAGQNGATWADTPVLSHASRKLSEARSHALGAQMAWREPCPEPMGHAGDDPGFTATLLPAIVRAAGAERELAAIRASHSWRITAPMRWLREALR